MAYYAVKKGKNPGIYETWAECQKNTNGFSGAKFHKFDTIEKAKEYMEEENYSLNEHNSNNNDIHYPCAFVDGSYNGKKLLVGAGAIIKLEENGKNYIKFEETYSAKDPTSSAKISRNIYGEIKACIIAINFAIKQELKEINVYYDYLGIEMWGNKQWNVNKEKKFVTEYIDLIDKIRKENKLKINFYKVPAHTGIELNEKVDLLAKEAAGF